PMATVELDEVDTQLLTLLQENARYTALELADEVGVSDNTVHNRIARLEENGIITGYTTTVDNERAGLRLFFLFVCTARISERATVADEVLTIPQVVEVTEVMSGERNLLVKVYGADDEDISRVATRMDELALEINDEKLIKTQHAAGLDYHALGDMLATAE
ncbi:MAG: Lrp/AsnC family transcriptional regulator, partial [Actinomycetota bacterium]